MNTALFLLLAAQPPIHVGSKAFTEGVILGELATQALSSTGQPAEHKKQLGGTRLVFSALKSGDIDVYAEYTGTLREELYPGLAPGDAALTAALAADGLVATPPIGFNNSYGLAMRADTAAKRAVRRISDLAAHADLTVGVSNEFRERKDGWPGLSARYGIHADNVRGLDHDVSYKALAARQIDVTDCYTTDAEITRDDLVVLDDDLGYFPRYDAVFLYRKSVAAVVAPALAPLVGAISNAEMSALNARVRIDRVSEAQTARAFLATRLGATNVATATDETRAHRILERTREHALLVAASLALSLFAGLPLGVLAARRRRVGQAVLAVVGVVQTIPSLALLVLFVPLAGIGTLPAVMAMVLYGLLPIVRNTYTGIIGIAPSLRESALALGLSARARLFLVELPLASPSILAGIQTSTTIAVGTATIGALVGAGGYGQSILTGIRLDDVGLILEGAVPAAAMAVLAQLSFVLIERALIPAGLRLQVRAEQSRG